MYKHLSFRAAAREKILNGASALAEAVRVTLGPKSRCMLIQKGFGHPIVCDDGVTIAREIELQDPEENLGAQMIREAAERTGDAVGDGTTTSTIIAHSLLVEGIKNVAAGASAVDLRRGIEHGTKRAVDVLRSLSRPIQTRGEKVQIAAISAHGDITIGELVAEAVDKVGAEGVISVQEAKGTETTLEVVAGMQFDRGFLSPYFITDPVKMEAILDEPLVLIYEKRISTLKDILPILEQIAQMGKPLLIIADDVDGEALATLVVNRLRGVLTCTAVKAPGFGDRRKEILQDIATVVGGKFVAEELGIRLENIAIPDLGRAQRIVVSKDNTTIIGGAGAPENIERRRSEIRGQIEKTESQYDRDKLKDRLAKLSGGVAVIHVGALSEAALKNRKEAIEDAINATKAAITEGIVPGGGLTLLRAAEELEKEESRLEGDERTGIQMLRRALEVPTRQIAKNSGFDEGVVVANMHAGEGSYGFDAARGKYVDLIEVGIIDPTKVVRMALENAASVAGVLLLAEGTVTEVREKSAPPESSLA